MQKNKAIYQKMMAVFFFLLIGFVANSLAHAVTKVDESNPVALLQSLADQMIAALKNNQNVLKSNPKFVYDLADKIVVPHANLLEMSKRVLPPKIWSSATPSQRIEFQKEFTSLLVRTYATALTSYDDQSVTFHPIRGGYQGKSTVEVDSEIASSDNPSVHVIYRLIHVGQKWELYDMSVEGVSLIESFRSQFADILSQGDMASLLKRLTGHNAKLGNQT